MIYDYNTYYRQNCIVPLLLLLFATSLFAFFLVQFLKYRLSHSAGVPLGTIVGIVISLFLIIVNIIPLARGGIYLVTEKETDAIQLSGKIEQTIEIGFVGGAKYGVDNNHGYGEGIVVNGEMYYVTTYYDYEIGDDIVFWALPKSRFVLLIETSNK